MKTRHLLFVMILFLVCGTRLNVSAQEIFSEKESNGNTLSYKIIGDHEVAVTQKFVIMGDVEIPAKVQHNGISYNVTAIEERAFYSPSGSGPSSIIIPNSVTSIGNEAFAGCESLSSIIIPSSVTNIGDDVFTHCIDLTSIIVAKDNPVYDNRNDCNAIIHTSTNTLIAGCNSSHIPATVTTIGKDAFLYCYKITSLSIPNSVTSIGEGAFGWCMGLTAVNIPASVVSIGNLAFSNCTELSSITVDKNNSQYDSRDNCNAIIHTSSNTMIAGCKNTRIPNSVTSIGENVFSNCNDLTKIFIPKSVKAIGKNAFLGCEHLTTVNLPESLINIGEKAFYGCKKLTNIDIPESVTSIGENAFGYCFDLSSIHIPKSVILIGEGAFGGCLDLTSITTDPQNPVYDSRQLQCHYPYRIQHLDKCLRKHCHSQFGEGNRQKSFFRLF